VARPNEGFEEHLMTRLTRPAAIFVLVAAATLPALADKAKSLYKQGQDAEARQNYEQAYDDYKQAYDLKPKDLLYRTAFERLRFLAAASHVHRGQLLREAGKLEEALAEFQKAAETDPSSSIAQQEIRRTQRLIDGVKSPAPRATAPPSSLQRRVENASGPVDLAAISNVPITLKATEDTKRLYETVGKLAGINVLFDPDYTSRRIAIELNGVSLEDALEIISLQSKTFWRTVTPNTIFVAADNPAKRKEIEQSVIKTFYLSNLSQTTELQEVVNTLRMILEISKIQPLPSQSAIVVRGTPDQIALAGKLVDDLDKAKPEVIVDLAIMQVSRDKIRNLGISPPTSASVALQNNINNTSSTNSDGTTTTPTNSTSGTSNQINLNRLGNLNATDFTVTIPAASATAMFSDSDVKLLQNPQIRAVDGQKGSLKIGDRVPVATGSFQPGIGGVGINPLVNTQFQYLDVGVNIDITPRVHSTGEISLKVSMEISSVTSHVSIGGIDQPVIGQRKIEHEIRLREGEVNLLGGMLEDDDIKSLSGIPGLAKIPILKYLFSQSNVERRQNEIVFVMVPHVVRGRDLTALNESVLSVGTSNAIELRSASRPQVAPATSAPANNPVPAPQPPANQPQATQPQATQPQAQMTPSSAAAAPGPASAGAGGKFVFDPPSITQPNGSTFSVSVLLNGTSNVFAVPLQVTYDPKVLQVINVSNGGLLSQDGQAVALAHREDESTGTVQITATRPPASGGVSGNGSVVVLTMQAKAPGQSMLVISQGGARDPGMQAIPVSGATASVTVQ
jgi:general secretion pathway protein D